MSRRSFPSWNDSPTRACRGVRSSVGFWESALAMVSACLGDSVVNSHWSRPWFLDLSPLLWKNRALRSSFFPCRASSAENPSCRISLKDLRVAFCSCSWEGRFCWVMRCAFWGETWKRGERIGEWLPQSSFRESAPVVTEAIGPSPWLASGPACSPSPQGRSTCPPTVRE